MADIRSVNTNKPRIRGQHSDGRKQSKHRDYDTALAALWGIYMPSGIRFLFIVFYLLLF